MLSLRVHTFQLILKVVAFQIQSELQTLLNIMEYSSKRPKRQECFTSPQSVFLKKIYLLTILVNIQQDGSSQFSESDF